jgi:hypothetical protein
MKLEAPPYDKITVTCGREFSARKMNSRELAAFAEKWPGWWPVYRGVLEELFSEYDYGNLFEEKKVRVAIEKLVPDRKTNDGADLLLRFAFDDTGTTWDIFQKGRTIVHAQPVF